MKGSHKNGNREENLKKINAELEKLSDDELEKVAGGLMPQNGLRGIQGQRRNEKLSDDELEKIAGGFYARSNEADIKKELNVNIESQSRMINWTVY